MRRTPNEIVATVVDRLGPSWKLACREDLLLVTGPTALVIVGGGPVEPTAVAIVQAVRHLRQQLAVRLPVVPWIDGLALGERAGSYAGVSVIPPTLLEAFLVSGPGIDLRDRLGVEQAMVDGVDGWTPNEPALAA